MPESGKAHVAEGPGRALDLVAVRPCGCARVWRRGDGASREERLAFYRDAANRGLEVLLLPTEGARGRFGRDCSVCRSGGALEGSPGDGHAREVQGTLLELVGTSGVIGYERLEGPDLEGALVVGPGTFEDAPTSLGGGLGIELGGPPAPRLGPSGGVDRG